MLRETHAFSLRSPPAACPTDTTCTAGGPTRRTFSAPRTRSPEKTHNILIWLKNQRIIAGATVRTAVTHPETRMGSWLAGARILVRLPRVGGFPRAPPPGLHYAEGSGIALSLATPSNSGGGPVTLEMGLHAFAPHPASMQGSERRMSASRVCRRRSINFSVGGPHTDPLNPARRSFAEFSSSSPRIVRNRMLIEAQDGVLTALLGSYGRCSCTSRVR